MRDLIPDVLAAEARALVKFSSGPGNWRKAADLFNLDLLAGFPAAFKSARLFAMASRLRLCGTILKDVPALSWSLRCVMEAPCVDLQSLVAWKSWYDSAYVLVLERALLQTDDLKISVATTIAETERKSFGRPPGLSSEAACTPAGKLILKSATTTS